MLPLTTTPDDALREALKSDGLDGWAWITAAITIAAAVLIAQVVRWLLRRALLARLDPALGTLIARLAAYLIIVIGLIYGLEALGVQIGPILGALGIAGIALAFALQDILENFVAGVLLQLQRPFTYGDQVSINDHEGTISGIDSRLVTIQTPSGETVKIPSATVIKADIVNYTQLGQRRTTLPVGVAYGTDLDLARTTLAGAVVTADGVLDSPEPEVLLTGFGDSSIDFAVRFWHGPTIADYWAAQSAVAFRVHAALDAAGITIPFPQRTVWWAGDTDA
ncbi:MAG: mechanosensitive ion channel family protein [Ilumatobacter sp.]|nr:mechanosensitive ion channel family protein [Ilumatobacter sp.]